MLKKNGIKNVANYLLISVIHIYFQCQRLS